MRSRPTAGLSVATALFMAGISGCGGQVTSSPNIKSPATSATPIEQHMEVSLVKEYTSIDSIVADSTLVVRVQATSDQKVVSASADGQDELTSTLTAVKVLDAFVGSPDQTITIRQSGSSEVVFEGLAELLVPGEDYILYLSPFTFDSAGSGTGEWTPTGAVGEYHLVKGEYQRAADDATALPDTVDPANPLIG